MTPTVLKLSVCLFNNVTALDYLGPIEQLGFLSEAAPVTGQYGSSAVLLRISYLAPTLDPVKPSRGPYVLPTATYAQMRDSGEQADILLLPGGSYQLKIYICRWTYFEIGRGARPDAVPQELIEYIQTQSTRCKYLLSVCTGSWILAHAGLLEGKEATTNKAAFKECKVGFYSIERRRINTLL